MATTITTELRTLLQFITQSVITCNIRQMHLERSSREEVGHVARMGKEERMYVIGGQKQTDPYEAEEVCGWILLEWMDWYG
jgi:hypothetical protein